MKQVTFSIIDSENFVVAEAHSVQGLAEAIQALVYVENIQLPIEIRVSEMNIQKSTIRQFK